MPLRGFFFMNALIIAQTVDASAGLTETTFGVAFAAGVGVWVIPIACIALLRAARKGMNVGGSVL